MKTGTEIKITFELNSLIPSYMEMLRRIPVEKVLNPDPNDHFALLPGCKNFLPKTRNSLQTYIW